MYLFFLSKTDESSGIRWRPDKKGFTITDYDELTGKTLPENFNHKDLELFIKQLKEYHFVDKYDQPPYRSFSAPHFDKDQPDLKVKTRRRILR